MRSLSMLPRLRSSTPRAPATRSQARTSRRVPAEASGRRARPGSRRGRVVVPGVRLRVQLSNERRRSRRLHGDGRRIEMSVNWQGVLPAITTPFTPALALDVGRVERALQADDRRGLRRRHPGRLARRGRDAHHGREGGADRRVRRSGRRRRLGRRRHRRALDGGCSRACATCGRGGRRRRSDGSAAVRVLDGLARDETRTSPL